MHALKLPLVSMFVLSMCASSSLKAEVASQPQVGALKMSSHEVPIAFQKFSDQIFADIHELLEQTPVEFRDEVESFVDELKTQKYVLRKGDDQILRPIFVSLQGDFEKMLGFYKAKQEITSLIGFIHTPLPATPLCTEGDISPGLLHKDIVDTKRIYATMKRPEILRSYLNSGAVLVISYAKDGLSKRTELQQDIYSKLLKKFEGKLIDHELLTSDFPLDKSGALYLFKTADGRWGAFAIKATQAIDPQDGPEWGMWFGELEHPQILARVQNVLKFLKAQGSFDALQHLDGSCPVFKSDL